MQDVSIDGPILQLLKREGVERDGFDRHEKAKHVRASKIFGRRVALAKTSFIHMSVPFLRPSCANRLATEVPFPPTYATVREQGGR